MFSNSTQPPTSYSLNVALNHSGSGSNNHQIGAGLLESVDQQQARPLGQNIEIHHNNQHQHNSNSGGSHQRQQQHQHEQQLFIGHQSHHLQQSDTINNLTAATFFGPSTTTIGPTTSVASTPSAMTIPNQHVAHQAVSHVKQPSASQQHQQQHQQQHHHHQLGQMVVGHPHQAQYEHQQHQHQQHQQQQQPHHQQQLTCVNVVNADSFTNQLATAGHVIFDHTNGLLRFGPHADMLNASSQAAIVVNTISELRQQQQQQQHHNHHNTQHQSTIPTFAICDNDTSSGGNIALGTAHYGAGNCQNLVGDGQNSKSTGNSSGNVSETSRRKGQSEGLDANNNARNVKPTGKAGGESAAGGTSKSASTAAKRRRAGSKKGVAAVAASVATGDQQAAESPRRTFACPTCGKGFTEKFNMKRHMQVHSQSRPKYICNECSKSFAWKDNFIRHKKAAHNANASASFPV